MSLDQTLLEETSVLQLRPNVNGRNVARRTDIVLALWYSEMMMF
jgi:hypothetical protein